jgi:diguanylate cyclase (GGDEF)-like protein
MCRHPRGLVAERSSALQCQSVLPRDLRNTSKALQERHPSVPSNPRPARPRTEQATRAHLRHAPTKRRRRPIGQGNLHTVAVGYGGHADRAVPVSEPLIERLLEAALPIALVAMVISAWLKRTRVFLLASVLSATLAALALAPESAALRVPLALPMALMLLALWPDARVLSASSALYALLIGLIVAALGLLPDERLLAWRAALGRPLGESLPIGLWLGLFAAALALLRWIVNARAGLVALAIVAALSSVAVTRYAGSPAERLILLAAALFLLVHLASQAYRMSFLDPLTELHSRRALTDELSMLGPRAVLAMLDIDHFKSINDRHGHDVGDLALKRLARHLRSVKGARAFRFGGEEFCLSFSSGSPTQVNERLEQLRQRIEADVISLPAKSSAKRQPPPLKYTVSIGYAQRQPQQTGEALLKAADEALYRAKLSGRNRVLAAR